jgi:hypothetical protein
MIKVEVTPRFSMVLLAWFFLGVLAGYSLSVLGLPENQLFSKIYFSYKPYLVSYSLFCWVVVSHVALMPFAFFLMRRYGFKFISLEVGGRLIFLTLAMVGAVVGFGVLPLEGSNAFSKIVRALIESMDWFGAAVAVFLGLYVLISSIAILFKIDRDV